MGFGEGTDFVAFAIGFDAPGWDALHLSGATFDTTFDQGGFFG
jgi:hypothetical protein